MECLDGQPLCSEYTEILIEHDMDQDLRKALREMAEAITVLARSAPESTMPPDSTGDRLGKLEERSNWHRTIGWGIAVVYATAIVGGATWYIPQQLNASREAIRGDIATQLLPIQTNLARLDALMELKQSGSVSQALSRGVDFSAPKLAIQGVRAIALQATSDKLQTSPSVLADVNARIQNATENDPALREEAWSATLALLDYRSTLPEQVEASDHQRSSPLTSTLPLAEGNSFHGGRQSLDGFYWKDSVFRDVQIEYSGGPVALGRVRFINCTFIMRYSHKADELAALILADSQVTASFS